MRRLLVCLTLACALCGSLPVAAQAGKILSFERARGVTAGVAELSCEDDPSCDEAAVGSCRRQAIRRIRCAAINRDLDATPPEQCVQLVLVRLRVDGSTDADPGTRACG